ncbi:MAG: TRAP transporter large permease [Gammaproteobacteria bacterium]|jgi:tripartite ATP-independent transporter DctM subunit|nr:TRAP transporter large permease [Gammaproteobacteria bacterium]
MSDPVFGFISFLLLLLLIACRIPVAIAMGTVGVIGGMIVNGFSSVSFIVGSLPFETVFPYGLSVVPLFILMGVIAAQAGLSKDLYQATQAFVGHFKGGLAMSTVGACAAFGSICGSSLATVATMARVALPEMKKANYDENFAAATVAAGGTLGVLIPPSIIMVIYAILTEESVGQMFAAAILPGLLATILYMLAIHYKVRFDPKSGPANPALSYAQRIRAVISVWHVALLFSVVIGGIYIGWFSPTEAAAVGVLGALVLAVIKQKMTIALVQNAMLETASISGMIFLILVGTSLFNFFIESTMLPQVLVEWVTGLDINRYIVLLILLLFFIVLGMFMDALSMILLTLPFVFPLITSLDFNPIWFGILMVSVVEIGLITPPVGMNLFILIGIDKKLHIAAVSKAIILFVIADIIRIGVLIVLPELSLWLPSRML